eukprot:TRINITY_DN4461_c0_g1_i1.p1 TRINITY_DN4461_c0_g1~~TRINITY_DN4461_c0_g1_i1.p1  ORF type:complete len:119 (-),score=19.87 TRINITY_DN4461_c0_g1_i1:27-383(-)
MLSTLRVQEPSLPKPPSDPSFSKFCLILLSFLLGKNHRGAWCDICSKPSVPINWKCTCCYDYDLCSDCALNKKHTKKHAILKIYWSRFNRWSFNYLKPSNRWKDGEHKDDSDYEEIVV